MKFAVAEMSVMEIGTKIMGTSAGWRSMSAGTEPATWGRREMTPLMVAMATLAGGIIVPALETLAVATWTGMCVSAEMDGVEIKELAQGQGEIWVDEMYLSGETHAQSVVMIGQIWTGTLPDYPWPFSAS